MDRAFWKTVLATALGGLIALTVGYGAYQYGVGASLMGPVNRALTTTLPAPPEPAASAAPEAGPVVPVAAAAPAARAGRAPAPESTPNGSLPDLAAPAASGLAVAASAPPPAVSGDVLVIHPAGGGPKLLTNVPDAATNANLTPAEREQRQAELKRKEAAWKKFYERPASCDKAEGPALVECANHYIRAKRSFDALYTAGKL